jgi:hypothetical protein
MAGVPWLQSLIGRFFPWQNKQAESAFVEFIFHREDYKLQNYSNENPSLYEIHMMLFHNMTLHYWKDIALNIKYVVDDLFFFFNFNLIKLILNDFQNEKK